MNVEYGVCGTWNANSEGLILAAELAVNQCRLVSCFYGTCIVVSSNFAALLLTH